MIRSALIVLALVGSAWAGPTLQFTLNVDHCSGSCLGGPPYGTVTLTSVATDTVEVTLDLLPGFKLVDTGFDGSFLFNLSPNPATITATNIQIGNPLVAATHWSLLSSTPGSLHFDGFGDFEYAMRCDDCQGGGNAVPGPLVFDITGTGLDTTSFEATSTGSTAPAYFGVDLFAPGPPAHTGPVGATGLPHIIRTPEPSSFLLFGTTALAFFAFVWHRKRSSKGLIQK